MKLMDQLDDIKVRQQKLDQFMKAALVMSFNVDNALKETRRIGGRIEETQRYAHWVEARVKLSRLMHGMRDSVQALADERKRLLAPYV